MELIWNVEELREALVGLNRDDQVVINIHDDVFYEDNYMFYMDVIDMGNGRNEIQLCPVQNKKEES
jgi:hypothetical protein